MTDDRKPKHGDIWFLAELEADGQDDSGTACIWHIAQVFDEKVAVYDEIDWPPKAYPLFVTPEPPPTRRGHIHGYSGPIEMPGHAVLLWRDKEPISVMDVVLSFSANDARHLQAVLFRALADQPLMPEAKRAVEQIYDRLKTQTGMRT